MECSNKINHYIYELERSKFGPILEMWVYGKLIKKDLNSFKNWLQKKNLENKKKYYKTRNA